MPTVTLPNSWVPRPDQRPLWDYLERDGKRAVAVCHRRWGKDDVALHWTAVAAHERVGTYWHMLPEAEQARKAIWNAVNPRTARRRIDDAFPPALRDVTRENEMFLRFKNGSTWQVVGSDNYDSFVGSPPVGVVFSEWALADPNAFAYTQPILRENKGWAVFIYTPRGRNHGATFYEEAKHDPAWFAALIDAEHSPVFSAADLAQERRDYIKLYGEDDGEARYRQEYLCDFSAALIGAYYGALMNDAEADNRIAELTYDPSALVTTAWDIGVGASDSTAIWFAQRIGFQVRVIDYLETTGQPQAYYAAALKAKPYHYGDHILPHDAAAPRHGKETTQSVQQMLRDLGIGGRVLPQLGIEPGIEAVRRLLPQCVFDRKRCARGIEALRNYRRAWDERLKTYKDHPVHDWSSHGADAFRYLATGLRPGAQDARFDIDPRTGKMPPLKYPRGGVL